MKNGIISFKMQARHGAKWAYTATERVAELLKLLFEGQHVATPQSTGHSSFASLHSEHLKVTSKQTSQLAN
jgi:hypothetical protein